jgi:hypothetical protein
MSEPARRQQERITATPFRPDLHGFRFGNGFVDEFVKLPGGKYAFTTRGRCGGMAFLALDLWHHKRPVPACDTVPADDAPLAKLIQNRLFDSFILNGLRYIEFALMPLHPRWRIFKGAAKVTRNKEFPKVKASIDAGEPCPIGLCQAESLGALGGDHQVVCYGYVEGPEESALLIWDNNHPSKEMRLAFATRYSRHADMTIRHSDGSKWRAFFLEKYRPEPPPEL